MLEATSTWVSRHWAAAADAASREPLLVKNHQRQRVVVLHEELAREFLVWYAAQEGRVADPIAQAAAELDSERQQEADERSVRSLAAKWRSTRIPRFDERDEAEQSAVMSILLGHLPQDRGALHRLVEEFRDVPEPDSFIAMEEQDERERRPGPRRTAVPPPLSGERGRASSAWPSDPWDDDGGEDEEEDWGYIEDEDEDEARDGGDDP